MSTQAPPAADPALRTSIQLLEALTEGYAGTVSVRFWDGSTWCSRQDSAAGFILVLRHPGALRNMMWPFSAVAFGEAYIFDDFDIEGDIFAFTPWLAHLIALRQQRPLRERLRPLWSLLRLPRQPHPRAPAWAGRPRSGAQGIEHDRKGISFHYDRPAEFYRLFLGPTMQYTCSYFADPEEDLDVSQQRKMEYICRKLRLRPGERFLDVGCGWGGLLIHAAKHYGVEGVGVTLAGKQAEWAERAVRAEGLQERVRIHYGDYRQLPFRAEFDKASSVGMCEEVGRRNLPTYFRTVWQALKTGGTYLHHSITLRPGVSYPRWTAFARKYVFPNGQVHTLLEALRHATAAGFEIRDVENLREHYTLTLKAWVRRLEASRAEAVGLTDEVNYRIYRIYMAGATLGFDSGTYHLNQTVLVKPDQGRAGLPLTRADWSI
ncbi:MAG TPA: cyclopropane-fatty-acyl-phospholipid synthase family protein [Gemmataceae bacterium]|jgi:cyclopropane-fatty-acyl-phospholipid synthase|nr:cyclopropane-fatty-acyl-phospholipid synthase family protein [Gemmataceae bacterium]